MADEVITMGMTRYIYRRLTENLVTISASTIDTSATNGGTMTIPVADARAMWAGLRAAERYQRIARATTGKADAASGQNSSD